MGFGLWFNTALDCSGFTIYPNQIFEIWGMRTDHGHLQVAFEPGDNGFLRLTIEEASTLLLQLLSRELIVICGYPLSDVQKLELAETIRELLPEG